MSHCLAFEDNEDIRSTHGVMVLISSPQAHVSDGDTVIEGCGTPGR